MNLLDQALAALEFSHSPYSHFRVGAAVRDNQDRTFSGTNIENAAYTPGICAERLATFKAISEGAKKITQVVIVTETEQLPTPCGVCLQVLAEFCDDDAQITCANSKKQSKTYRFDQLLPHAFRAKHLEG